MDMATAVLRVVRYAYRGEEGHLVTGRDTRGRRVRVFTAGERARADLVRNNIQAGRDPFAPAVS